MSALRKVGEIWQGQFRVKDVARLAGVSSQTVSRVANNSSEVKPETRLRVERAMEELGYRPNYARAREDGSFKDVGVVLSI